MKHLPMDIIQQHPDYSNPAKHHRVASFETSYGELEDVFKSQPWCSLILLPSGDGWSRE